MPSIFRITALSLALAATALAEPIAVKQTQGSTRGFLVMRSEEGKMIARGELNQVAHGDTITTHMTYRFLDGSLDDETATFTQRGTFHLLRDRHIQKGPYFPKPMDISIDTATGMVTSRTTEKDGFPKVETERMELPADLYNGLIGTILLNASHNGPGFKIGMVALSGKGRLVKLAIEPAGTGRVSIVGLAHTANIFRVKVELGGVAGVVAPIIGKQPRDVMVWILPGEAPGLIREIAQLYNEGPTVSIELSGTTFPPTPKP